MVGHATPGANSAATVPVPLTSIAAAFTIASLSTIINGALESAGGTDTVLLRR